MQTLLHISFLLLKGSGSLKILIVSALISSCSSVHTLKCLCLSFAAFSEGVASFKTQTTLVWKAKINFLAS